MEMNSNRIAMCAIGGVAAAATIAFGVMIWLESGEREEIEYTLESQISRRDRNADASAEVTAAENANRKTLADWAGKTYEAAAEQGRRVFDAAQDPVAFKSQMVEQAREFGNLPGDAEGTGKIVKDDFGFGFDGFVKGGKIPAKDELPRLQRQWYDIMRFLKTAAGCGAREIIAAGSAPKRETAEPAPASGRRRPGRQEAKDDPYPVTVERYAFKFKARPAALVQILNALSTDGRLCEVETMSFEQEGDPLAAVLGATKEKDKNQRSGRRRRASRRDSAAEGGDGENEEDSPAKKGLVTDPASCAPFTVAMTLATYEFAPAQKAQKEVEK